MTYQEFIEQKSQIGTRDGFEPLWMPDFLFDFQRALVEWALLKGRAAIFADCLAGATVIHSPDGDITIADAATRGTPMRVWTRGGDRVATAPWVNGYGALFEIVMKSGACIIASAGHRMLTPSGWKRVGSLSTGELLLRCDASRLPSIWESFPPTHAEDGPRFVRTIGDSQSGYHPFFRFDDAQLPSQLGIVQCCAPSRDDARERSPSRAHWGETENECTRSRHDQHTGRLSMRDYRSLSESDYEAVAESQGASLAPTLPSSCGQSPRQCQEFASPSRQDHECVGLSRARMSAGVRFSYSDSITAIRYIRNDYLYDMHVPGSEHFLANGFWVHNCGLGKTPMQLVWAQNVVEKTCKPVLVLTPLSVGPQTICEAIKFGIEAKQSRDGSVTAPITVTNYQQLHKFSWQSFGGVVCDESSILKSLDGAIKTQVTDFMRMLPYRLLCTATAAPNDYIELGTSSEALGGLRRVEMLAHFFNHDGGDTSKWRLKKHAARGPFWRWLCSWARAIRKPEDIGFAGENFILPKLTTIEHIVTPSAPNPDCLFDMPAVGLEEQRAERRRTIRERCEMAATLINATCKPAIAWCHLNEEGHRLAQMMPGSVEVCGADTDEFKEETFEAFCAGQIRILVTKPSIGGMGLNFQHCAHQTFFPSHSFEQWYQCIRRSWRFGQQHPVRIDVISSPGESGVLNNMKRKSDRADEMFAKMIQLMNHELTIAKHTTHTTQTQIPTWLP